VHDSPRTRLVLGLLLAAALALIAARASPGPALRSASAAILSSAKSMVSSATRPVTGFFASLGNAPASQAKITALEREVVRLRAELWQAQLDRSDWAQLHSLEQLAGRGRYRIVAATVTAAGPGYPGTVTIDAGSADRIKPQETVLNGAGLVGTVTAVSAHTATVVLATDPSAKAGVRVAGTREIGVVSGLGPSQPGLLRLQVFDAGAVLRPGEQLVTYASIGDRPYVPGVPVGVITRVQASALLTKGAYVRPFANDGTLGVVGVVIAPPRKNPGDSVLATPPGHTATAPPSSAAPRR